MSLIPGISPGTIIELYSDSQTLPQYKSKISVIIGICPDHITYGTVFFNSTVNMDVLNSQELLDLQVTVIPGPSLNFLKRKSYVDCSDIKNRTKSELKEDLRKGRIMGQCPERLFLMIIAMLKSAQTSKRHYLELYGIVKPDEELP